MRKILCVLLAIVIVFGMVACGGDKTAPESTEKPSPSQPTETPAGTTPNGTTPEGTIPDGTMPENPNVSDGAWIIKTDVAQPTFTEPQKVTDEVRFTVGNTIFNMELYQADWSQKNPEEVMNQLKQLPLFEGWSWHVERVEKGYGALYSDVGQQRNFEYSVSVVAEKPVDYITHRISVTFNGKTNEYSGWRGISVHYSTPDTDMGAAQQEVILPVLQVVYGEDVAQYMAYAPVTETRYNDMTITEQNTIGSEKFKRHLDDRSVSFSQYAYTKLQNSWKQYTGDYEPMLGNNAPECYSDIFKNFGSMNFNNIKEIGSEFLSEYLQNYDYTAPGTNDKLYTYTVTEYENGDKDVELDIDMVVYQNGAAFIEGLTLELEYTVEVRSGVMDVKRAKIHIPALCEDWDNNDPEDAAVIKRLNDNLTYAKQVANAVFDTNFEFSEVYWNGSGDYKLKDKYKIEMFGREVNVSFEFTTKTMDSIGANRASFTITIS